MYFRVVIFTSDIFHYFFFYFFFSMSSFCSFFFFFSSRRRHTRCGRDWSSTCALPICDPQLPVAARRQRDSWGNSLQLHTRARRQQPPTVRGGHRGEGRLRNGDREPSLRAGHGQTP